MIGEPAWDMMLALYITERSESRMTTTRLAEYAGAAMTTALRWIDALAQHGFVVRKASPTDKRVVFIELSDQGRAKLDEYFGSLSSLGFDPDSHG